MFHEHLQTDIIRKDGRTCTWTRTVRVARHVRRRWVEFGQQETSLRTPLVTDDITRNRQTVFEQFLRIANGRFEQLLEVFVSFLILIVCFSPLCNRLSVENENVEKCVEQQNDIGADRDGIEQDGVRVSVESVRHEGRLNHDQRIVDIGVVQDVSVKGRLVWRVVEHLEELRTTKMEHELRVNGKVGSELERRGIFFAIFRKLLAQPDEHTIEPTENVWRVVDFGLEHGDTRHEHRCGFLVKGLSDGGMAAFMECTRNGSNSESVLTRGVLVVGDKLDQTGLVWSQRLTGGCDNFKVGRERRLGRQGANLPGGCLADTYFGFSDAGRLFVGGNDVSDHTGNLELFGGLSSALHYHRTRTYQNLESSVETHLQESLVVLSKRPQEALLENGRNERIGNDHKAIGSVGQRLHFEQTDLIETSGVDIDSVAVDRCSLGQRFVVLMLARSGMLSSKLTLVARLKCLTLSRSMS